MVSINVAKVLNTLQTSLWAFDRPDLAQGVGDVQKKMGEYFGPDKFVYDAAEYGGGILVPEGVMGQGSGYWRLTNQQLINTNVTTGTAPFSVNEAVSDYIQAALLGRITTPDANNAVSMLRYGILVYMNCLVRADQKVCEGVLVSGKQALKVAFEREQAASRSVIESEQAIKRSAAEYEQSGPVQIMKAEKFVQDTMQLAKDMRAKAVEQDSILNRTTPKHVDGVTNKYYPLLIAASGSPLEKSQVRYKLALLMVEELFKTPTGENLFWDLRSNPLYTCSSSRSYERNCDQSERESCTGAVTYVDLTCSVLGRKDETSMQIGNNCECTSTSEPLNLRLQSLRLQFNR